MKSIVVFGTLVRRVALNEFRVRWTLTSTWVFFASVFGLFAVAYASLVVEYYDVNFHSWSDDILISPKYFTASLLTWCLVLTTVGVIILGSRFRASDTVGRSYELIESRPISNLQFLAGRFLCYIALSSIPILVCAVFTYAYAYVIGVFEPSVQAVPVTWSVVALILYDIVPNLALWGALAMVLTVIFRSQLVGALLTCAIFLVWSLGTLGLPLELFEEPHGLPVLDFPMRAAPMVPLWLAEVLQPYSASSTLPSELAPMMFMTDLFVQRVVMLLVATGLLCVASTLLPRSHTSKLRYQITVWIVTSLALSLVLSTSFLAWQNNQQRKQWALVHDKSAALFKLDLEHLSGKVVLRPAQIIDLDLSLTVRTPKQYRHTKAVLTFNPGFQRNISLSLDGVTISSYDFQNGLLTIPWDPTIDTAELRVIARGVPNESFAYLDSTVDMSYLSGKPLRRFRNLGTENLLFHSDYVALLPGVHWYPTPGVATGRDNLDKYETDFFTFELEISTRLDWLLAAPGSRTKLSSSPGTFKVQSSVPVPSFAILSSRFERHAMTVEGVEFELLISPQRQELLDSFVGFEHALREWIVQRFQNARELGVEYPFDRFTVVEVPSDLRMLGGGWQMNSVFSLPGLFLIHETGLPRIQVSEFDLQHVDDSERRRRAMLELPTVLRRLELDVSGNNPFSAFSSNFLSHQTKPTGSGAVALKFVIDQLLSQSILERAENLSAYDLLFENLRQVSNSLWWGKEFASKYFDDREVWYLAESVPLSQLHLIEDSALRSRVLWHKGYAIIRTVRDYYTREELYTIFSGLLEHYRGDSFTFQELTSLSLEHTRTLDSVIGDLLTTTKVPGYVVLEPHVFPILGFGVKEYLTSLTISNEEDTPGFLRFYDGASELYKLEGEGTLTDPIWFEPKQANQIAIRSAHPFRFVYAKPYFSLNRSAIRIVPLSSNEPTVSVEPTNIPPVFKPITLQPSQNHHTVIVVDDLDPEFTIVHSTSPINSGDSKLSEIEVRLPRLSRRSYLYLPSPFHPDTEPYTWHRIDRGFGFGTYRKTQVRVKGGQGSTEARFHAQLPHTGLWHLDYYWDSAMEIVKDVDALVWYDLRITLNKNEYPPGNIALQIINGTNAFESVFENQKSDAGWLPVGAYSLVEGEVSVVVSDVSIGESGDTVYADAIRWSYLGESSTGAQNPK